MSKVTIIISNIIFRVKDFLKKLWKIARGTAGNFLNHNCPVMAAGMSFFGLLSLIPLILLGVSFLGYVIGSSESAQKFISKLLSENFPSSASEILNHVNNIIASPKRAWINGLSVLGLMWSGMRFFNILQGVLNSIWVGATQRRIITARLFALLIFAIAGFLFWLSFIFTSIMVWVSELNVAFMGIKLREIRLLWLVIELNISFISWIIMLFLIYFFIPNAEVSYRSALMGAIFASFFLLIFKYAFSFIMLKFDVYGKVYGPLTGFIIFMSWLYFSMTILLLGAELGSQCQETFFKQV